MLINRVVLHYHSSVLPSSFISEHQVRHNHRKSTMSIRAALLTLCYVLLLCVSNLYAQENSAAGKETEERAASTASDDQTISLDSQSSDDNRIASRLRSIFNEIDELGQVVVQVDSSVVTLTGTVDNADQADRATRLAEQLQSVVQVINNIEVNRDVGERVESVVDESIGLAQGFLQLLPLIVVALLIIAGTWWLGRWVSGHHARFMRFVPNAFIAQLVATVLRLAIIVAGLVAALYLLDLTSIIGTVLGAAGILGLALGFAVKDTVENFVASVLLSIRHPFSANELVDIDGIHGSVARLTSRATILISADGNHVRIPNSQVFKAVIVNFSRQPQRRIDFTVFIDENANMNRTFECIMSTLEEIDAVLENPAPTVTIEAMGETTIKVGIYFWIDQRAHDFQAVKTLAMIETKHSLRKAEVAMPSSIQVMTVDERPGRTEPVSTPSAPTRQSIDEPAVPIDTRVLTQTREHTQQAGSEGENLLQTEAKSE